MGMNVLVVGAGIFGVTSAIELRRRGHDVTLVDPGPVPHPLAASTDISKAVRMDYGPDDDYLAMMEAALEVWREWNRSGERPLFHESGVAFLTRAPMRPGGFEYESFTRMASRGHRPERLDARAIAERFPAWSTGAFVDGYFNPEGGWAESGAVVERLVGQAVALGITVRAETAALRLEERGGRVVAARARSGEAVACDAIVIATGSWTPHLLPEMAPHLRSVGMPVFHLVPPDPRAFEEARFPTFGADISRTGWYGFPLHPRGVVKIANHGAGREMHPESPERVVVADEERRLREFLRDTFPTLTDAPIVHTRVCLYSDTWDGHFWIDRSPSLPNVVLATGGSGHGFKFAPLLGGLVADALEGRPNRWLSKFRWRPDVRGAQNEEAARHK